MEKSVHTVSGRDDTKTQNYGFPDDMSMLNFSVSFGSGKEESCGEIVEK